MSKDQPLYVTVRASAIRGMFFALNKRVVDLLEDQEATNAFYEESRSGSCGSQVSRDRAHRIEHIQRLAQNELVRTIQMSADDLELLTGPP